MANNKIVYYGETLMDLTNDTVTPDTLVQGTIAHNRAGEQIVGTFTESDPTVPSWAKQPSAPVTSVNSKTGAVTLKTSDLTNDSGYITADDIPTINYPVTSVNSKTGAVVLTQDDVGDGTTYKRVTSAEKTTWNNKSNFSGSYNDLTNKPTIPTVDSSLSTTSTNAIQNKVVATALNGKEPSFTKNTAFNKNFGTASGTVCEGNDTRLSNARPASDVSAWAKASSKPTYTASEVGALPTTGGTVSGTLIVTGESHLMALRTYANVYFTNSTDNSKITYMYTNDSNVFDITSTGSQMNFNGVKVATIDDVNTAIANAVTNALNTAV